MKKIFFTMLGVCLACYAWAGELEEYKQLVALNIAEFDGFQENSWQFRLTSKDGETVMRETFDPKRSQPWKLINVNGQTPSQKQLVEYYKKKNKNKNKQRQAIGIKNDSLRDVVPLQSLVIADVRDHLVTFSFEPRLGGFSQEEQKKLKGTLLFDLNKRSITALSIDNTAKLKPNFFVTLRKLSLHMDFLRQNGHLVLRKLVANVQGNAGFLKTIEEESEEVYTDYVFIGEENDIATYSLKTDLTQEDATKDISRFGDN